MKSRLFGRLNAVVLVCVLALAPSVVAAPRDREAPRSPGERIVRIIKQIRSFFVPAANEDGLTPPKP